MPPKAKRLTKKEQQALARKQVLAAANSVDDFMPQFAPFANYEGVAIRSLPAAGLTTDEKTKVEALFCANMQTFYEQSSWGFDIESKRAELFHADARYLVAGDVDGFLHFRFVEDDGAEVLYVYELQIGPSLQRKGLGKRLMQLLELIGRKYKMKWILLTVFKANTSALTFYTHKLGYDIDETSPSQHGNLDESYEILSKPLA
ncbi:N-acetyltransferase [Achlya hypogyna]|uniref:N-alpha-acetyltransferase 40 n=1 Tax=Achlya hypogyna TaxID=1202772 RepID=A0A1V9YDV1_ACHHY|nr:N-acetyltransferase [Achlya hypogyna]